MRTLHVGLRGEDLDRSLRFWTSLGYDVVGTVPETEFGSVGSEGGVGDPQRRLAEACSPPAKPSRES